jgi:uncharacterized RDD family membrane protein YckC
MKQVWMISLLLAAAFGVHAAHVAAPASPAPPVPPPKSVLAAPPPPAAPDVDFKVDIDSDEFDDEELPDRGADMVTVGNDAHLPADKTAKSVVAVMGSATSEGAARDVVAVVGDATVKGPVDKDVVAVLGNVKLDNSAGHDVVAVLGSVDLGPNAKVGHDVVVIGGTLKRDPAATIGHTTNVVTIGPAFESAAGLRAWVRKCLFLGRPLALDRQVGWAWGVAFVFLALYVLMALLFRNAMSRCVRTFQERPGSSMLAALLSIVLTPLAMIVLVITVVGMLFIPVLGIGLLIAGLFGKAVLLAWMGQALTQPFMGRGEPGSDGVQRAELHPALAVIIGGLVMMALYLIPFLGFLLYKLTDLLGLGIVLLTLLLALRAVRGARKPPPAAMAVPQSPQSNAAVVASLSDATAPAAAPESAVPAAASAAAAAAPAAAVATTPEVKAHAGMERASFWQRMAALFLDFVLVGIVLSTISHADSRLLPVLAAYGCVLWVLRGTTIGGSVLGLHVVRLDGRPVDWSTGIVRALGCFLSAVVAGLGFIWIAFDPEKQAWHDKIAGTVVVRRPGGTSIV